MKIDTSGTKYNECPDGRKEFDKAELKHLRLLLRRLRFLETQLNTSGGLAGNRSSAGAAFVEWEVDALEWLLVDIGFVIDPDEAQEEGDEDE